MSTVNSLCGDCTKFKPGDGAKFFNCTLAKHSGVNYGMQVRTDTRSCEAFVPRSQSAASKTTPKPVPPAGPDRAEPRQRGLCRWGKSILIAVVIMIVCLLIWAASTCFSGSSAPLATPSPQPTTTPPGPTPTAIPATPNVTTITPVYYYSLGDYVQSASASVIISSVEKMTFYSTPGPVSAPPDTFFIFASITMFNTSSSSITVGAVDFSLVDSSAVRYSPQPLANSFYGAFPFKGKELQAGRAVNGKILYLVQDTSSGLEIQTTLDGYILGWKLQY